MSAVALGLVLQMVSRGVINPLRRIKRRLLRQPMQRVVTPQEIAEMHRAWRPLLDPRDIENP